MWCKVGVFVTVENWTYPSSAYWDYEAWYWDLLLCAELWLTGNICYHHISPYRVDTSAEVSIGILTFHSNLLQPLYNYQLNAIIKLVSEEQVSKRRSLGYWHTTEILIREGEGRDWVLGERCYHSHINS